MNKLKKYLQYKTDNIRAELCFSKKIYFKLIAIISSVAERVEPPFLWQPCDHDCMIQVQLPLSPHHVVLRLNHMLYYALCLHTTPTQKLLFVCLLSDWDTTTGKLLGSKVENSIKCLSSRTQ